MFYRVSNGGSVETLMQVLSTGGGLQFTTPRRFEYLAVTVYGGMGSYCPVPSCNKATSMPFGYLIGDTNCNARMYVWKGVEAGATVKSNGNVLLAVGFYLGE